MFKRVDNTDESDLQGYSYINADGKEEFVCLCPGGDVEITDADNGSVYIYSYDIPNLIKALQAAIKETI